MRKRNRLQPMLPCRVVFLSRDVCRTTHSKWLPSFFFLHRKLWGYIQRLWIVDELEGLLLLRFSCRPSQDTCYFFLGRRMASPRRLMFVKMFLVDTSASPIDLPCELMIQELGKHNLSSFSLARFLLVDQPQETSVNVRLIGLVHRFQLGI